MATTLDIPTLLAPIPAPASGSAPVDPTETPGKLIEARAAVDEARRFEDPTRFPEGDPKRASAKKSEWPKVVELGGNCLKSVAKDLHVATRMTEALVQLHGFPGARDGFSILRQLVEKCWDVLYPFSADGDHEARIGQFNWLDSFDKGSRLPSTLCLRPLVSADGAAFSYFDMKPPAATAAPANAADIEKAIHAMPLDECEKLAKDIEESRQELDNLGKALKARMGDKQAPGLVHLRKAVDDCLAIMKQIVQQKRPAEAPKADKPSGQPATTATAAASPAATRTEIYRQLSQAAARLRELEPHSPIPYLIERAVELGKMPFPELLKDMVREQKTLAELYREYGVKEPGKK